VGSSNSAAALRHLVHFYDRPCDLAEGVGHCIADAFASDATVLIVATEAHRAEIAEWLAANDIDTTTPAAEGRYVTLDVEWLMDQFMVEGRPDPDRFATVFNSYLDASTAPVFAFGEMVALLWERGDVLAAVELETLWNNLGNDRPFTVYCAYRAAAFANCDDLEVASLVCERHSAVIPPASYRWTELPEVVAAEQAQTFLPVPDSIVGVRRFVAGALALTYPQKLVSEALLVASELATNAVRHAGGPFRAVIVPGDGYLRLEFHDTSPANPRLRLALTSEVDGRGLVIVDRLARRWGVDEATGRKVVWAEFVSR
jgi:anti-sigma regulatory factor (Ser/Thr protein kinase)